MGSDLLFYESADAYVEYYTVRNGYVAMNRAETWDGTWTHIVPGHFDLSGNQQFVCYDAVTGAVELATVVPTPQGGGGTIFGQKLIGWQPGYDILVAGRFENAGGTDQLLCYSRAMGAGETFQVEADEYPLRLSRLDGWRTSWTNIVPGSFGGQGIAGLLFYDAANRTGEFYAVDAGALTLLQNYTDWRTSWNGIVAGDFGGGGSTNLLFYDAAARTGEFYRVDGGAISLMKTNTDWRSSWVTIVAGNFSGGPHDDLLFYDRGSGTGEFWRVNRGDVTLVRSHTDWRTSWAAIVAGAFTNATKAKTPFVSVTIAPYAASFRGQREITIGGQGFAHGEGVRFFVRVDTYDDVPLGGRPSGETSQQFELYTQADGAGNFTLPLPGIFDVVCDGRPRSYHVYATGATSGTTSNGATVSCRWPDPASGDPVGARVPHPGATASE